MLLLTDVPSMVSINEGIYALIYSESLTDELWILRIKVAKILDNLR